MLSKTPAAATILFRAAEILRTEGWRQGDLGFEGDPHCLFGAICQAALEQTPGEYAWAYEAFTSHSPFRSALAGTVWNDEPGRTAEEVISLLESVAAQIAAETVA